MAEKKYVDLAGLTSYDAKIKALINSKDEATLTSAKGYADGLASNYDKAGAADAVDKKLTAEVTRAQAAEKKNADANAATQTQVTALSGDVNQLESDLNDLTALVGTLPADAGEDINTVVKYIDKKTSGIASDAKVSELSDRMTTAEKEISLCNERVQGNTDAIATLNGEDAGKSVRTIATEELSKQLIPEDASESLNTLQEIAAWIQQHPEDASAMNASIKGLEAKVGNIPTGATATTVVDYAKEVADAEATRAQSVESGLDTRVASIETKLGDGEGSVSAQIAAAVKVETDARVAADSKHDTDIAAAKKAGDDAAAAVTTLQDGKVAENATAIAALQTDSHTHANKTVLDGVTTAKVTAWDGAVTAQHSHSNKAILDAITQAAVDSWNAAEKNAKAYIDEKIAEFVAISDEDINKLFPSA